MTLCRVYLPSYSINMELTMQAYFDQLDRVRYEVFNRLTRWHFVITIPTSWFPG